MEQSQGLRAAAWMAGAVVSFSAMAVAGREIASELNTFELMTYRSAVGVAMVCALILASRRGFGGIRTRQPGRHALRNVLHFAAQNMWFFGVAAIPLAQLVSLEFTNPIWVAILAPVFLAEKMTPRRLIAAGLGFAGILIVARPGLSPLGWGHAAGLGAALGFALTNIATRGLTRRDTTLCILFWMTLSQLGMGLLVTLPQGLTLFSLALAPWIAVVGVAGLTAHLCLTSALSVAPASVVAPMEFARLPVIAALGALLYGEPLEIAVLIGAAVILAGNVVSLSGGRGKAASRPAE